MAPKKNVVSINAYKRQAKNAAELRKKVRELTAQKPDIMPGWNWKGMTRRTHDMLKNGIPTPEMYDALYAISLIEKAKARIDGRGFAFFPGLITFAGTPKGGVGAGGRATGTKFEKIVYGSRPFPKKVTLGERKEARDLLKHAQGKLAHAVAALKMNQQEFVKAVTLLQTGAGTRRQKPEIKGKPVELQPFTIAELFGAYAYQAQIRKAA
ncbi:MAG: hypothetical protein ABH854_04135 [Candidatus Diapherotrites archaeon]|nr:hypothetical protein [Candidatus Micrarchaeota archaeon]MBU1939314.1 hypothetical protein [Candidatus Micrarchaeota archaeon]